MTSNPLTIDDVVFAKATPAQREIAWRLNGASWAGSLSLDAHVERASTLAATAQSSSPDTGGRTTWVLHRRSDPLDVVSAADSEAKAALVRDPSSDAPRRVRAHGVASVYTAQAHRGRGLAAHLLKKLQDAVDEEGGEFSVLYSDIGTDFYGRLGWVAHPSLQVSLYLDKAAGASPPLPLPHGLSAGVKFLSPGEGVRPYCDRDVAALTERMGQLPEDGRTHVAFLPTFEQLEWQFTRDSLAARAQGREVENCGAATADDAAWVYWHHDSGRDMLVIHRLVAGSPEAARELLWAAVVEAAGWGLGRVVAWNPAGAVEDGARLLGQEEGSGVRVMFECREEYRRPCLRLKGGAKGDVVWEDNSYYAWC